MSGSATDSAKPSDASQRWRRTRAMASTKVGDGLSYQAAVRWVIGRCFCSEWPPRLDLELYPYLPRVQVSTTSTKDYMSLLSGRAA